jgi:hypothetical protein
VAERLLELGEADSSNWMVAAGNGGRRWTLNNNRPKITHNRPKNVPIQGQLWANIKANLG